MNVSRTINGKKVEDDQLKNYTIDNKAILDIVEQVRIRTQKRSRKISPGQ